MRDLTALGGTTVVTLVTMVAVLAFAFHKSYRHALVLGGAVLLAIASSEFTKGLYDRARPDLVRTGSMSTPAASRAGIRRCRPPPT